MPKTTIYLLVTLLVLVVIAAFVLYPYFSQLQTGGPRNRISLDQELSPAPRPGDPGSARLSRATPATSQTLPAQSAPTSVRADDTPKLPRPEPPRVGAITGSWGRNPFLTTEEIDFLKNPHKFDVEPEPQAVRLSTILTVNGKRTASINGQYVTVGDWVVGEKVVGISEYSLTLQRENGKTREIKLHEPIIAVRSRTSRK